MNKYWLFFLLFNLHGFVSLAQLVSNKNPIRVSIMKEPIAFIDSLIVINEREIENLGFLNNRDFGTILIISELFHNDVERITSRRFNKKGKFIWPDCEITIESEIMSQFIKNGYRRVQYHMQELKAYKALKYPREGRVVLLMISDSLFDKVNVVCGNCLDNVSSYSFNFTHYVYRRIMKDIKSSLYTECTKVASVFEFHSNNLYRMNYQSFRSDFDYNFKTQLILFELAKKDRSINPDRVFWDSKIISPFIYNSIYNSIYNYDE